MPEIAFPYGKEQLTVQIPGTELSGILQSQLHSYTPPASETELVAKALENPVGSLPLWELAKGKEKIVIIASDHTRPVPSRIMAPLMLSQIRKGNPDAQITFLISTGCHRGTTREELVQKFGSQIVENENIVIHDCDDTDNLVSLGTLPSGGELVVNRLAAEADLLVAEGFIEPHFFAGFSGGRKSVLPGIAGRQTVMYNHNAAFIAHPKARTGSIEGNPIHEDMLWAARKAKLAFICNVVINSQKQVVYAVAGDVEQAHKEGREFLNSQCRVAAVPSDIVISTNGGYPMDQNAYQAVKGMTAAEATVKPGGVIVMIAKCADGHGGESFYNTFRNEKDLHKMMEGFLKTPANETIVDQWQSQIFARVLMNATVIFVSDMPQKQVRDLHMIPAQSLSGALEMAKQILKAKGVDAPSVLAIPDGVSVMEYIFGVEFSAPSVLLKRKSGAYGHFHITGYHFDPEYPAMKEHLAGMSLRQTHQTKTLFEWGVAEGKLQGITWEEVLEYNAGKTWLCNEQLFRAMMHKGLAVRADHPQFFRELFGSRRSQVPPAYDFKQADEVIALIRAAGGVALLAHPHRQLHLVEPLMEMGIEGIEVWHPDLEPQEQKEAYQLALEKGLYISGGTDHYGVCDNAYENYPNPKDCPYYMEPFSAGTTYEYYVELRDRKISR